jgi:lipopolysaccharide export system protein LptC
MSESANQVRTQRQRWASPGSGHDSLIAVLRVVLPSAVGVVAAMMVFLPLTAGGDVSFVLDRNKVQVTKERLKVQSATYRGQDDKGQPFLLTAESALQRNIANPLIDMKILSGQIRLSDGPATIAAPAGQFDPRTQQVQVPGPITFNGPRGYTLKTNGATVDLKKQTMTGQGGVSGTLPQGTFTADRLSADLNGRVVKLDGRARLRFQPGRAK